ncbi:MAG: hypothetical protein KKA62_02930 [Nanoarchaeota archaeon]|nr:hypothetical protein [Nanoarchaeota archaeon]MBU1644628.1 hypothetical protein [Nanoarchaeota archaeon]MBU1976885.1 hypothetical protein [Nanoarchaeota archaeon]
MKKIDELLKDYKPGKPEEDFLPEKNIKSYFPDALKKYEQLLIKANFKINRKHDITEVLSPAEINIFLKTTLLYRNRVFHHERT